MNKLPFASILFGVLLMGLAVGQKPGVKGKAGMDGGMMHKHMHMDSNSCPMGPMFMHGMMQKFMVPTEDGGVVILIANQLYKYDKNLKLVKEAEIKIDTAKIGAAMRGMSGACRSMMGAADSATGMASPPKKAGG